MSSHEITFETMQAALDGIVRVTTLPRIFVDRSAPLRNSLGDRLLCLRIGDDMVIHPDRWREVRRALSPEDFRRLSEMVVRQEDPDQ